MPTRSRFPRARSVLILIDVINPFDFPGGKTFARRAERVARSIARLAARARHAGKPVIYVNDNLGRWRSDIHALVSFCQRPGTPGARVVETLCPQASDHVVLKSTLSGFFQTPLETMLRSGGAKTLVLTGFATDNCVLFTAADAYMRDFRLVVPRDCVAAQSPGEDQTAVRRMESLFGARIGRSTQLRLAP